MADKKTTRAVEKKSGKPRNQMSFILIVASVAFVCFSVILVINLVQTKKAKDEEYASLSSQVAAQNEENSKLKEIIDKGISDEEKERLAREEGYIFPGEHVYQDAS